MNDQSRSAYRPSCMFPTSASAIVHNFFACAANARIVLPLMAGAAIGSGAAHLPELDIDIVVDWPRSVTRQAARARSTLTGRHLILMAMRSPLVADDYEATLVNNDAGTITFLDKLQLGPSNFVHLKSVGRQTPNRALRKLHSGGLNDRTATLRNVSPKGAVVVQS